MSIADGVERTRNRIVDACARAHRDPEAVRIVAVAKGQRAEAVLEAAEAGIGDIGENRAQEFRDKYQIVGDAVRWHFVGNIQTNKVRYLDPVAVVHSVDRIKEAVAIGERTDHRRDVFVQVNIAEESRKHGVAPEEAPAFVRKLAGLPSVNVRGLMIVAPRAENPQDIRWVFAEARRLRDRLGGPGNGMEDLSMGMTEDFEVAVEEGATVVRIGRAIFREE